jgi:hypothetical protein
LRPLIEASAKKYASEHNITPRDCRKNTRAPATLARRRADLDRIHSYFAKLREIRALAAHRLRSGRVALTGSASELRERDDIKHFYLGSGADVEGVRQRSACPAVQAG